MMTSRRVLAGSSLPSAVGKYDSASIPEKLKKLQLQHDTGAELQGGNGELPESKFVLADAMACGFHIFGRPRELVDLSQNETPLE